MSKVIKELQRREKKFFDQCLVGFEIVTSDIPCHHIIVTYLFRFDLRILLDFLFQIILMVLIIHLQPDGTNGEF